MKVFDYVSAWHDLALPAYNALPESARILYARTVRETRGLSQIADLSMPWPEDASFRADFRAIDTLTLARAARAIYSCGHWKPSGETFDGSEHGAHWKFSHYADQELSERLGLRSSYARADGNAMFVRILEGYIRVCFSSPNFWLWEEVGAASESLVTACQSIPYVSAKRHTHAEYEREADAGIARALLLRDPFDKFLSLEEFMREECSDKYCHDVSLPGADVCARHTPEANAKREYKLAERAVDDARARLIAAETVLAGLKVTL